MTDDPTHKQCPDCAELVLAAARKCRYCGYRFDKQRRSRGPLLGDLFPGLIRGTEEATLEEILADWGTSLAEDEVVNWFHLADVDHRPGYLLVTSRRLVFFQQVSRTRHERALEYPLALLSDTRLSGSPMKRRLQLRAGAIAHAVDTPGHRELKRLYEYLERVVMENQSAPNRQSDA